MFRALYSAAQAMKQKYCGTKGLTLCQPVLNFVLFPSLKCELLTSWYKA